MLRQLPFSASLAALVSSAVFSALALILTLKLGAAPTYVDFITGSVAWNAETKLQDLIAAPVFISSICLSYLFFSFLLEKQKRNFGLHSAIDLSNQLIWWSLPTIAAISSLILSTKIDQTVFFISATGIGFISLALIFCTSKIQVLDAQALGLTVFSTILLGLFPLELALLLGRAPMSLVGNIDISKYKNATYVISVFGLFGSLFIAIRRPQILVRALPKMMLAGQIGLSTIFLTLYPARLLQPDGTLTKYETTVWLKLLVVGSVLYGIVDVVRRYRNRSTAGNLVNLLSPIALFGVIVGLRFGNTIAPHISPDDYHFGESLLGWWSYLQGVTPYVGYIPAHGLIDDDLNRFLSSIFYDGSAGSVVEAGRLGFAISAFAAFLAIYYFSGSIGLAFVSVFFLSGRLVWYFLTPFLCLWFSRSLISSPSRWLMVWILTIPVIILGVPPQGLLLVASSGVMAGYFCWQIWRHPEERKWTGIVASLAALAIFSFTTPLGAMLLGAVHYVLENGPINQIAYGIPWSVSWTNGAQAEFVFEIIRMSWIAIPVVCLSLTPPFKDFTPRAVPIIFPAIVILLFVLLLVPYSMGRIDSGSLSRPGGVAVFGWAVLLPLVSWRKFDRQHHGILVVAMTFVLGTTLGISSSSHIQSLGNIQQSMPATAKSLRNIGEPLALSNFVKATSQTVATDLLRSGSNFGLSNIGKSAVENDQWERLVRLATLLDSKLGPGESYLDLTSRNAQYFYLNRKPMIPVTAPYNMVPPTLQKRTIDELTKTPPSLALLEGANIAHDGGGIALRTPYLYRFIIENYIPRYESGFIIGYKKNQSHNLTSTGIDVTVKNVSDVNWDRGVHRQDSAIVIDNPYLLSLLKVGDYVRIAGGEARKIEKIAVDINSIWLDGARMDPGIVGHPNKIHIAITPEVMSEYTQALLHTAFSLSDFQKIPISWGRSEKSLNKKMFLVKNLDETAPVLYQLHVDDKGYKIDGIDPSLSFHISSLGLSGRDAGLLRFKFSCINKVAEPRIQVFWWGDSHQGPFEASSIRFTADEGVLIVPLDASPRWLLLEHLKGIRIDLDNATACSAIKVRNISLYRRLG